MSKEKKLVEDTFFHITDQTTSEVLEMSPRAAESCMNPGTFRITPKPCTNCGRCSW